jgi:hypothetical protein
MDRAAEVTRVVADAARLMRSGELIVFGSAALAFWMENAPRSKDIDVWCLPSKQGHAITALMGELSWYHEKHQIFVEVWAKETFAAPRDWRERGRRMVFQDNPKVHLIQPHPHDIMMAKLERMEVKDREHIKAVLAQFPLSAEALAHLDSQMPHHQNGFASDRVARYRVGLTELKTLAGH